MKKKSVAIVASIVSLACVALVLYYINTQEEPRDASSVIRALPQLADTITSEIHRDTATLPTPEKVISVAQTDASPWWQDAATYQIWVRSFYDSNNDGHGDLKGIEQKLDYIASLGVDAIWLSPIFESPSYHGYDTSNFYQVEKDFGTMEDFEQLLRAAKEKNIKVLLDLALNHVSEEHPWFQKSIAKDPVYDDYFIWSEKIPEGYGSAWESGVDPRAVWHTKEGRNSYYYGVFGWSQPDLNYQNPAVVAEAKAIVDFWLAKGVDGFRFDAIRYIIEEGPNGQADTDGTMAFWRDYCSYIRNKWPNTFMVGEALTDTSAISTYYLDGHGFDQAFEFGFNHLVASVLNSKAQSNTEPLDVLFNSTRSTSVRSALWENLTARYQHTNTPGHFFASFLNNHDNDRITTLFAGDAARAKLAASLLLLSPGPIYIYYGEEIGMDQHAQHDDMYRRALMQWNNTSNAGFTQGNSRWLDDGNQFPWIENFTPWWKEYWHKTRSDTSSTVESQKNQDDSLLNLYRELLTLRLSNPTISSPASIGLYENTGMAWVVKYAKEGEELIIVINLDPKNSIEFVVPQPLLGKYTNLRNDQKIDFHGKMRLATGEIMVLEES